MIKRCICLILVFVVLTFSINVNYCKAGAVAEPVIGWSADAVLTALFALVGISVEKPSTMDEQQFIDTGYSEQIGALADQFADYIVDGYNAAGDKVGELASEFAGFMDGTVTGQIERVSADMYNCLKSFVNEKILGNETIVNLPVTGGQLSYASICGINGIEYEQMYAQVYERYIYPYTNAFSFVCYDYAYNNTIYDKFVTIGILPVHPELGYVFGGGKLKSYDMFTGKEQPIIPISHHMMFGIKDGRVVSRWSKGYSGFIFPDEAIVTSISKSYNIFSSYSDLMNAIPIVTTFDSGIVVSPGLDKLRDRYGNLDNLDTYVNGRSVARDGVIGLDIPSDDVIEGVLTGELEWRDVLPIDLVDVSEGVVIDDAYVDDAVPDNPAEELPALGDIGTYVPTADLTTIFPFCIPFDLIKAFKLLRQTARAPYWEVPLKSERFNIDYTFVIDFSRFESLATIFRIFETVLFIVGLILVTRNLIKG